MWKRGRSGVCLGEPMGFRCMGYEPTEEAGVVFLFGMVAQELGYHIEAVRGKFPDCLAKRRVGVGQWEAVRIEFEFESRNFREHGHRVAECDLIVCWHHNWPQCPLEVMELKTIVAEISEGRLFDFRRPPPLPSPLRA